MASTPAYAATPKCYQVQIATANTNRDGTGTLGTVATAPANGLRIERIVVTATGTTTAGMIRLYVYDGAGTARLWAEIPVVAITPSGTAVVFTATLVCMDFVLQSGYVLKAAPHNAETFNVHAFGAEF